MKSNKKANTNHRRNAHTVSDETNKGNKGYSYRDTSDPPCYWCYYKGSIQRFYQYNQ